MKKQRSTKREILFIVFSLIVVLIPTIDMLGHPLRVVHLLTISAGSFAVGVSAGKLIERIRTERRERSTTEVN